MFNSQVKKCDWLLCYIVSTLLIDKKLFCDERIPKCTFQNLIWLKWGQQHTSTKAWWVGLISYVRWSLSWWVVVTLGQCFRGKETLHRPSGLTGRSESRHNCSKAQEELRKPCYTHTHTHAHRDSDRSLKRLKCQGWLANTKICKVNVNYGAP